MRNFEIKVQQLETEKNKVSTKQKKAKSIFYVIKHISHLIYQNRGENY